MLSLHLKTYEMLRQDKRTLLDIHKESGLPFYWLRKFHAGRIPEPSVNKVQALYEFLSNKPLEL